MTLDMKSWIVTAICLLLVGFSLFSFRWLQLQDEQLQLGKTLIDSNQTELRKLKRNIDEFNSVSQALYSDTQLGKAYFEKKVDHYSEFDRNGVENIDAILDATYSSEGFFELSKLVIKQKPTNVKEKQAELIMIIEGKKRLEKQ